MSKEASTQVVLVTGLYPNLPIIGEKIRAQANEGGQQALQASLGELANVHLYDPAYHDKGTHDEITEELDAYIGDIASRTDQPVPVVGSSLGGNLAFGTALRMGRDMIPRAVAISAPLRADKRPPRILKLRLPNGNDLALVEDTRQLLEAAGSDDLARLSSVHGSRDPAVRPNWSKWPGISVHEVPGRSHPTNILTALGNPALMKSVVLGRQFPG